MARALLPSTLNPVPWVDNLSSSLSKHRIAQGCHREVAIAKLPPNSLSSIELAYADMRPARPYMRHCTAVTRIGCGRAERQQNRLTRSLCRCSGSTLPPHLVAARRVKKVGIAASAGVLLLGLTAAGSLHLPDFDYHQAAVIAAVVSALLTAASTGFGGKYRSEWHKGRLYVQWGEQAPVSGVQVQPTAIEVRCSTLGSDLTRDDAR